MKVRQVISAQNKYGDVFSTMEEIYVFRTTSDYVYLICSEGAALIQFEDEAIRDCWYDGRAFRMPKFTLSITDFMEELRKQGVLDVGEMVTDVYTEEEYELSMKVMEEN